MINQILGKLTRKMPGIGIKGIGTVGVGFKGIVSKFSRYLPLFTFNNLGLMNEPTASTTKTNTRTSISTLFDHEGLLVIGKVNEIIVEGGRRERTLYSTLTSSSMSPLVDHVYQISCEGNNLSTVVLSGAFTGTLTNDDVNRQSFDVAKTAITGSLTVTVTGVLTHIQIEDVTGRSNQAPSEKLDVNTDYGHNTDGVKYYSTENDSSVSSNIVTEAVGVDINPVPQVQNQDPKTNRVWPSRDFTHANWVAINITPLIDAVGLDGVINTASTLTADAANGTLFNSVTLGSLERTTSFYVRRKTGTGTIEITDDGGTGYTDITSSINSTTYTEVKITTTQANPSIGFRIVTSGDEIEVDAAQLEDGTIATTPIETTTVALQRQADIIQLGDFDNWLPTEEVVTIIAVTPKADWAVSDQSRYVQSGTNVRVVYRNNLEDGLKNYDGVNNPSIPAGHTPGTEIIAVSIGSLALNKLQIGYYKVSEATWHWGTATAFQGFTPLSLVNLGDGSAGKYTQRGLLMYDGLPPGSDATLAEVQTWAEANAESELLKIQNKEGV